MKVHQIMPGCLYGDAIGNQAVRMRDLLREWGFDSQIYAEHRDTRWDDPGLDYRRYRGSSDTLLIYHYSLASELTDFVKQLPDQLVVYYHNVTPAHFLAGYNPELAASLRHGREQLASLRDAHYAIAASDYNRQEMLDIGFEQISVLPYFIYFDELLASAESKGGREVVARYGSDECVNLLFVGRIVPNKRQDDLIRMFGYYHRLVNPNSRLFLVGSDANAPGYRMELEILAEDLGLKEAVIFTGPVGLDQGLGGYFRAASVFVCLSEHEGFCVPLLEAMAFDLPVLAYKAAGVPYTLGYAGLMVNEKRYDVMGELVDLLASDSALRQRVVQQQRLRLRDFSPEHTTKIFRDFLDAQWPGQLRCT